MDPFLGLLCFLIALAFGLLIVAVIGHGIWVLVASIFGSGPRAETAARRPVRQRACVGCGTEFARDDDLCPACGLDRTSDAAAELKDLEASLRTVDRLAANGALSPETCTSVAGHITARREELLASHCNGRVEAMQPGEQLEALFGAEDKTGLTVAAQEVAPVAALVRVEAEIAAPVPVTPAPLVVTPPVAEIVTESAPAIEQPAPSPRRSFAEWVAVFMEERNILWGELIGGSLIVGCSIALVISLWQTLEQFEFFPFIILATVTSALFGAGFYTLHHWKLESTSRGLLLIATLLVPLDFLVLAGLTREAEAGLIDYASGAAALLVFGWLLYRSARVLIQTPLDVPIPSALAVTLSILLSAGMQLAAMAGLRHAEWQPHFLYVLGLAPVLGQVAALGCILLSLGRAAPWSFGRVVALLFALGGVTFACVVTLCVPLFGSDDLRPILRHLSPALTLLGVPILLAGTMIHQKLAPSPADDGETHGLLRTLGSGLALAGLFVMLGGFAVAVDEPAHRWLCGLLNIVTLLGIAWSLRVPTLHVPAQAYLAMLVVYGGQTDVDAILNRPEIALRFSGLLIVQAVIAEGLVRLQRRLDARYYAIGSGVSTVLAGVIIAPHAMTHPAIAAIVLATAALTWFAANLRWRFAWITYASSAVLAGAIFFTVRHASDESIAVQGLWSLLAHATVCWAAAILLRYTSADWLRNCFRMPLQFSSLVTTFCAVTLVTLEQINGGISWSQSCVACCILGALWLTMAAFESWPTLFGAAQAMLGAAWVFGAGAWLLAHGWEWQEPHSLHVFGLGLAVLSLAWETSRIYARTNLRAMALLTPAFVPIDRIIAGALVIGQYSLTLAVVSWSLGGELSFAADEWRIFPAAWYDNAYAVGAWVLPPLLAGVLIFWLREGKRTIAWLGLTLLISTLPILIAGACFDATLASASAARWGLAICYGVCSIALWQRHRLTEAPPARAIRALLAVVALAPALLLTLAVVVPKLAHQPLPGPLDDSIFMHMGGPLSLLIPLALFSITLAGHGFRERLAYYLLAAGLLANASGLGGYFLALQRLGIAADGPAVIVHALLVVAGVAWAWSLAWTWMAGLLERTESRPLIDSPLLQVNDAVGVLAFVSILVPALRWIMFSSVDDGRQWAQAAGSNWTWPVYGLMALATGYQAWQRRAALPLHLLGILSLTAVGIVACAVERFVPDGGFVTLQLLCGLFACVWAWSNLFLDPDQRPSWLTYSRELWESVLYAVVPAAVAALLGSAALGNDRHDPIWSAQSVALAAAACGLLAYQRKTEHWATFATMAMMLAGTILTVRLDPQNAHLALRTIHVNLAVMGAMSLAWLGLHRFLAPPETEISRLRLLPAQIVLAIAVNGFLLLGGALSIVVLPDNPGDWLRLHADWAGWAALGTNVIAAVWYTSKVQPRAVVHAVGMGGLLLGVVLAGAVDTLVGDKEIAWLAHHVLTVSWTMLAVAILALSWLSHTRNALGPGWWQIERRTHLADFLRVCFAETPGRVWASVCGGLVVLLAVRAAWAEPAAPWWPVGNTLAVIVLLAVMAAGSRRAVYVYASTLLANVIGWILFSAWAAHGAGLPDDEQIVYFVLAQAVSFASAAIAWSLLEWLLARFEIAIEHEHSPVTQQSIVAGVVLLVLVVGYVNVLHLSGAAAQIGAGFAWAAIAVVTAAALLDRWRAPSARFTRLQLYLAGLAANGCFLHGLALSTDDWCRIATLLLAAYVLLVVLCVRALDAIPSLRRILHAEEQGATHGRWIWPVQLASIGMVLVSSTAITLTYLTWQDRLAGAIASALVTAAAFLIAQIWPTIFAEEDDPAASIGLRHRLAPSWIVLTLSVFIAIQACWSALHTTTVDAVWLQRNAAALTVVIGAALLYRFGLPRLCGESSWADAGRSVSAALGPFCVVLLVMLLGQELLAYNPDPQVRKSPLRLELVIAAALAILGLTAAAVRQALTSETDAYGIEGERRSGYIYLAEFMAAAAFAHLRLNVPDMFSPVIGRRWYFVVMALAFAALGVSEIFKRRGLRVLATPLRRSSLVLAFIPLLAFRLAPLAHWSEPISARVPGLSPFLHYLQTLSDNTLLYMPAEAVCWLLLGIFFGWLARLHRSANVGILAALAVNFGVWVLLGHEDATKFLQRPQLWLIPLGLIVLIAEFINRDRLGFWPSLSVRYVGLFCIYLSSTFEMFKELVHANPIYPIALVLLAVGGMLLGILFRVRAFLLSGFLALIVVIFAQIWNAAVYHSHTWVWWASGIILGVIILAMFALFEKHRNGVLKMLDGMKRWN